MTSLHAAPEALSTHQHLIAILQGIKQLSQPFSRPLVKRSRMLLFRKANCLLLPAYSGLSAISACRYATTVLTYDTSTPISASSEDSTVKGRTAGEMGDAAAQSIHNFMKGAEGTAVNAGGRVEPTWACSQ